MHLLPMSQLIFSLKIIYTLIAILLFNTNCNAQVKISVDSAFRHIFSSEKLTLPRGEITSIDLHSNKFGDHYEFRYTTTAPIKIFLIKQKDIEGENPTPNFLLNQTLVGSGAKIIQVPANDQYAAIILKNENNYAADSYIRIDRLGKRTQSSTRNIENILNITIDALSKTYNLPNIKIIAKPCGEVNAFSTPNIVICTELIGDLAEKGTIGAIHPILLHELAHSLMYLWKIGDYRNEDLADEFAMVLMAISTPDKLNDLIEWFNKRDSKSEILLKNINGSRHSLSKKRAENARRILQNPNELVEKWGKLMHPHKK